MRQFTSSLRDSINARSIKIKILPRVPLFLKRKALLLQNLRIHGAECAPKTKIRPWCILSQQTAAKGRAPSRSHETHGQPNIIHEETLLSAQSIVYTSRASYQVIQRDNLQNTDEIAQVRLSCGMQFAD